MKKKIYLVPHMHWDREWYFTIDTANVLLNTAISELLATMKNKEEKMLLDGQWSLVDEFIKWNPEKKERMTELLKSGNISAGPLYTQPDVFNSQGETTLRNFEIGRKVAKDFGVKSNHTAHFPDTFGFNDNFPQILKHAGMKNFIHWRGIPEEIINDSDVYTWKGIDGSKVKAHTLKFGYYTLSVYYPYSGDKVWPDKNDPEKFAEQIVDRISRQNNMGDIHILPLGGDQAPYQWDQKKFLSKVQKHMPDYEIEVIENFEKFMDAYKRKTPTHEKQLKIPFTGKIHRTIGGSRYDIKQAFRNAENSLYHQLEPLEVLYSGLDKAYNFENYKDELIHKPLMIAQAHDSLGGCNTDVTNRFAMHRLERIQQNIDSGVDNIFKKLEVHLEVKDDEIMFYNPAPFTNDHYERKTIYTKHNNSIDYQDKNFGIFTIGMKNIGINGSLVKRDVLIYKNNNKPLSLDVVKEHESNTSALINKDNIFIKPVGDALLFKIKNDEFKIRFNLIQDFGDSYDFSPGKPIKTTATHKVLSSKEIHKNLWFTEIETKLSHKGAKFIWEVFIDTKSNKFKVKITTMNKLKETKVSLDIEGKGKVQKSQHLVITDFNDDDYNENWKERLHELPAHVDINDGLVSLGKLNIITNGNNELYKTTDGVRLTLFRSYPFVTQDPEKTTWRPVTSGLSWFEESPDAQLNKKLTFNFVFSFEKQVEALNKNKFNVMSYYVQQRNFIARKMTKFAINDIIHLNKKGKLEKQVKINAKDIYISSMRMIKNTLAIRAVNMISKNISTKLLINNKEISIDFKPYEIKLLKYKGEE